MDSNELLPSDISNQLPDISSSLTDALAPLMLLSVVISFVFIAAYIFSVARRWKVEKAILAIQKDIREMNERDRARAAAETPPVPAPAATESPAPVPPAISEPPMPTPPADNSPDAHADGL